MPALTPSTTTTTQKVLDTVGRVLAPLARLMIAKGVTFQMASEVMKRAYVRAAQKHFVEADDAASGTKLSLLTGLNRKEIRRLTSEAPEVNKAPMASYASAVNAMWRTNRRWKNKDGSPKVLPRRGEGSFDELVRSVTTDHRPSAVFAELSRLKHIAADENDCICLVKEDYRFGADIYDRHDRVAENIEDHLTAAVTNLTTDTPKFLERSVYSDELSSASAAHLVAFASAEWEQMQNAYFKKAIALETADANAGLAHNNRIRIGMYVYSEARPEE